MAFSYVKWTRTLLVAVVCLGAASVGEKATRMQSAWALDLNAPSQSQTIGAPNDESAKRDAADESILPPPPMLDDEASELDVVDSPEEGVEVMTRGPVHEAFAEPVGIEPQPSLAVAQGPPADIEEVPPDVKPEGDDVLWIPGYWAWDDEREEYLWVSGIWRKTPPGRRWVPGYWAETEGGWQWISGLWGPTDVDELSYHQTPPASLEAGPSSPAPGEEYFWVPGYWLWSDARHRWRPGCWMPYDADRIWVAAHWVWTPRGCLFVPGYWDYRVACRGQLFAPVRFHPSVVHRPHFRFTPWCVLDCGPLLVHLWVRPTYCHYYFGDYYGATSAVLGFVPWCQWHGNSRRWDPILTHNQVHYHKRYGVDYIQRMNSWQKYYLSNKSARPARTLQGQLAASVGKADDDVVKQSLLAMRLDDLVATGRGKGRFTSVSQAAKETLIEEAHRVQKSAQKRVSQEKVSVGTYRKSTKPSLTGNQSRHDKDSSRGQLRSLSREPGGGLTLSPENSNGRRLPSSSTMSRSTGSHASGGDKPHTDAHGNSARSVEAGHNLDTFYRSANNRSGTNGNGRSARPTSASPADRGSSSSWRLDIQNSSSRGRARVNSSNGSRGRGH